MDWKNLVTDIAKAGAPILGGVLGGPGGATIGAMIAGLFDADPNDPQDIAMKMAIDPEATIKLQELELDHKIELEKLYLADMQSARQREQEITKATGALNTPMYILAGVIVVGFFVLMLVLMKCAIPENSKDVAFILFGALSASFVQVVSYFFGSSKGSADKNILIKK